MKTEKRMTEEEFKKELKDLEKDHEKLGEQMIKSIGRWAGICKCLDRLDLVDSFLEGLLLGIREVEATNLFRYAPKRAEGSVNLFEQWPLPPSEN